jgi:hypothetical protein
LCICWYG